MLALFLAWPTGLVWGNIAAELIIAPATLIAAFLFRNWWMPRFVAFHHKHKNLHAQKLEESREP